MKTAAALLVAACAPIAAAQQGARDALVILLPTDTLSVERILRSPRRFEAELVIRQGGGARFSMSAELDDAGLVRALDQSYRPLGADPSSPPLASAHLVLRGDSAIVDVAQGGNTAKQRLGTRAGAMPYLNPSFGLIELVLARAIREGRDSVTYPLFALQGGRTADVKVTRLGADSAVVDLGGVVARLAVAGDGSILGGTVPSQGLRIVRLRGVSEAVLKATKPDYSAPPDAPYASVDVVVPTREGHSLGGTLTVPKGATGPVAAFVTITGSGSQDRDETISLVKGYRLFREVADALGRSGIAVLRMDDRGNGASGGNAAVATSADFANDIRAGLEFLRHRPEIDAKRLGLIGHSEGGMIAPMVAAGDSALRAIVLMAGPAWTGRRIVLYQQEYAILHDTSVAPAARDSLRRVGAQSVDSLSKASPWFRFFLAYDPLGTVKKVHIPVLILQGATDRQVTAEQAQELAAALRAAGNRRVTMRVFPSANHLFVEDASGDPSRYTALPSGAVRRDVLDALVTWARETMRATR